MIEFDRFVLKNGLRVIHHYDPSVSTVVINTLYNVGARDENPKRTGFAHLFEHLMFAGSKNVPSFDQEIENAGGQNNAFTNNEYTNYYISVPVENVETAFWIESDRMFQLNINDNSLKVQKGVVVEEFKQRCYNAPFGELWHHIRELLYKESPYRWPTIGITPAHVEEATLEDVKTFYDKYYHPKNAILSIAGNLNLESTKKLCEKWFESIERVGFENKNKYIDDTGFTTTTRNETDLSPSPAVFLVWKGPHLGQRGALELDVFADMLGGSEVSILQEADHIYMEVLKKTGEYDNIWQAFAVLVPVKTVGVMGDQRTYENLVALRAVTSVDGMTADWYKMPSDVLSEISSNIVNNIKGVNRVVYDVTSKPPGTIEWE